jgi:hypothetical protein
MPSNSSLSSSLDRTHHAFIVDTRSRDDGTVVLYLSRRYASATTGVGYRTAMISSDLHSDYLIARSEVGGHEHPVEIVFRGTNYVRAITVALPDSIPTDEYLTRDGGHDYFRHRRRLLWRIQLP